MAGTEWRPGGDGHADVQCGPHVPSLADMRWHACGLWAVLQPAGGRPISVVGAGGKSAAITRLISEWRDGAERGSGIIATVTTRLKEEQALVADRVVYTAESIDLPTGRGGEVLLVAERRLPDVRKIEGLSPDVVCHLAQENPHTPIVVEADGAAGALLKVAGAHEPVIPLCSATVVAVMGFPALAGTVVPHAIHRYDRFTELFGGDVTALSTDVIARLLAHHQGSFVGAPDGARRCWLINQVAGDEAFRRALSFADEVCDRLQGSGAIDDVIVGAVQSELPLMHRVLTDRPATLRTEEP